MIIFLSIVLIIIAFLLGAVLGARFIFKLADKALKEQQEQKNRTDSYYEVLNQWMSLKNKGISLEQYFIDKGYKKIAIYGFAEIGKRLYEELENREGVTVAYIIDQNAGNVSAKIPVLAPSDELAEVDAIVVTPTFAFYPIEKNLRKYVECDIVSIEDVVFDI